MEGRHPRGHVPSPSRGHILHLWGGQDHVWDSCCSWEGERRSQPEQSTSSGLPGPGPHLEGTPVGQDALGYPLGAARAPARGDVPGGHRADPGMEWGGGRQREGDGVGTSHRVRRQKGNRERGRGAQAAPRDARRTARISRRKPPVLRVLGTPQTCPWVLGGEKANPHIIAASHPKIPAAFREKNSRCEQKILGSPAQRPSRSRAAG